MARIRAAEWGTEDGWHDRIDGYLNGSVSPRQSLPPRIAYVAIDGITGEVVGLVAGHLTKRYSCGGELQWMNVVCERRGSGIADNLLRCMAKWFATKQAMRICVDVQPSNAAARSFYFRNGASELNPHWLVWEDISLLLEGRSPAPLSDRVKRARSARSASRKQSPSERP